jgi:hypothetical protein
LKKSKKIKFWEFFKFGKKCTKEYSLPFGHYKGIDLLLNGFLNFIYLGTKFILPHNIEKLLGGKGEERLAAHHQHSDRGRSPLVRWRYLHPLESGKSLLAGY